MFSSHHMNAPSSLLLDRTARVERWTEDVAKSDPDFEENHHHLGPVCSRQLRSSTSHTRHTARPHLTEITGNSRLGKRKAEISMTGREGKKPKPSAEKRKEDTSIRDGILPIHDRTTRSSRRIHPPKPEASGGNDNYEEQIEGYGVEDDDATKTTAPPALEALQPTHFAFPPSTETSDAPSSPSKIRRKRGVKYMDQTKPESSIDMQYLEKCNPRVLLRQTAWVRQHGGMPDRVNALYQRLRDIPTGACPSELKVSRP